MAWNQSGNIRGASGVPGASGAPGATGPQGPQGPTGASGASGGTGGTGGPGTTTWAGITDKPGAILNYKGTWNASTNTPTLSDSTGSGGDVYRVSVGGSRNLGSGTISWEVGDYAIYSPVTSSWEKADTTDAVSSVAGRTGAVTLTSSDLGASGSASSSTFLRGDNTWATPSGITRSVSTITSPTTLSSAASTDYVTFCSSAPSSDTNSSSVSILLPADGSNNSTTFKDLSPNDFAIIRFGDAKISTTQSKFGGSSAYFDGSGDYLSITSGTTSNIPNANQSYTIEAWIYPTSTTGSRGIIGWGNYGTSNAVTALNISDGKLQNYWWANDLLSSSNAVVVNTWQHVAATFDGTTRRLYVGGTLVGSDTPVGHNVTKVDNITIGVTNSTEYFVGYIDDLRVTKGIARYTSAFTPPTSALPTPTFGTPTLPSAASVGANHYTIKNISGNSITVGVTSSQQIDGATGGLTLSNGSTARLISDGSNWRTV